MNQNTKPPSPRTLDRDIPELKSLLQPGLTVLDVGCGTGTITLGVAEMVYPGDVVGIDPSEQAIDVARQWADQASHRGNIIFQVGDSHHLPFPDDTFNLAYSHTALHFFLDPILGLQEQRRVVKKGGWVIASGVRDTGFRYPPCPHWEQLFEAFRPYWDARLAEYHASSKDPATFLDEHYKINPQSVFYFDIHAGRKCVEWFHTAGLRDLRIEVQPRRVRYQRAEGIRSHGLGHQTEYFRFTIPRRTSVGGSTANEVHSPTHDRDGVADG